MERRSLSIPELAIIGGTRAALGAGLGLLLGDYLAPDQRRAVGWTLLGVGLVSTVPIAVQLFRSGREGGQAAAGDRLRRLSQIAGRTVRGAAREAASAAP